MDITQEDVVKATFAFIGQSWMPQMERSWDRPDYEYRVIDYEVVAGSMSLAQYEEFGLGNAYLACNLHDKRALIQEWEHEGQSENSGDVINA